MTHQAKIDWWMAAAIALAILVLLLGVNYWIAGPVLLVLLICAYPQSYKTTQEGLLIRGGLWRRQIPYEVITFVGPVADGSGPNPIWPGLRIADRARRSARLPGGYREAHAAPDSTRVQTGAGFCVMAMEKLFHFDSPRESYRADACVITCFDARFDLAVRKFLKRRGVVTFDHVKIPGGVKSLAAPECDTDRDFVLRMVRTSMRLHGSERVLIVAHSGVRRLPWSPHGSGHRGCRARRRVPARQRADSWRWNATSRDFDGVYSIG